MKIMYSVLFLFFLVGCNSDNKTKGEVMINDAIEFAGCERFKNVIASFTFRDKNYTFNNDEGEFNYIKQFINEQGDTIVDELNNEKFTRTLNGSNYELADSLVSGARGSLNSVIYFAFLPFGLNDPAVYKEYIGKVKVKGEELEKVKITFDENGGGEDHHDIFYYYFEPTTKEIKYLAYQFFTNDGGIRFREAINPRRIGEIYFLDYINYKPIEKNSVDFDNVEKFFNEGKLQEISRIELEDINVKPIKEIK